MTAIMQGGLMKRLSRTAFLAGGIAGAFALSHRARRSRRRRPA